MRQLVHLESLRVTRGKGLSVDNGTGNKPEFIAQQGNPADSLHSRLIFVLDDRMIIMAICRLVRRLWDWIRMPDFRTAFIATMLGVLAAFALNSCWHQHCLNEDTKERLHLVYLESQYNVTVCQNSLRSLSKPTVDTVFIKRPQTSAISLALQDDNLQSVLPPHKISLLMSYLEAIAVLQLSLDTHKQYVIGTRTSELSSENDIIKTARSNAAATIAMCHIVQKQFGQYFNKKLYDRKKMRELEEEVKRIKEKALLGKTHLSRETE